MTGVNEELEDLEPGLGGIDDLPDLDVSLGLERRIALIAHDNKKADLLEWAQYNRDTLARHHLVATGTTGRLIAEALDVPVDCVLSGPLGGDQMIGAMIATGKIDLLIFFWDPLEPQPHDPDVKALLRLGAAWNTPMACNRSTADYLVSSPLLGGTYIPTLPDYGAHDDRDLPDFPG